jgi:hypothetical protein
MLMNYLAKHHPLRLGLKVKYDEIPPTPSIFVLCTTLIAVVIPILLIMSITLIVFPESSASKKAHISQKL